MRYFYIFFRIKNLKIWSGAWGDCSLGKVLAMQTLGPEFNP